MKEREQRFIAGRKSSFEGATVGTIFREGDCLGHELSSYRKLPMGIEVGDGCVLY